VALGKLRTRARRPLPVPVADPEPSRDATVAGPETPERALQRHQDRERVYRVLDAMTDKKRDVLILHEIEGHDLTEIARILNVNPVTIRTRLFYARKEFFKRIARGEAE
jgi:RNA polymerase sigma-70 factor (ECF subfamily)